MGRRARLFPKVGDKFGRLTIISDPFHKGNAQSRHVTCKCGCGNIKDVLCKHLYSGHTTSCGCFVLESSIKNGTIHGGFGTRIYGIWSGMIQRCHNPKNPSYKHYGGRGITVCAEWRSSFAIFREWSLSHGYRRELQIDRRDNESGYLPDNCRWATSKEQACNKRNNTILTAFGETKPLIGWAEDKRCAVNYKSLGQRIRKLGWDTERAIKTPKI